MLSHDYLSLKLARVNRGEAWASDAGGLHFLLPREGRGQWSSGRTSQPLEPGDVFVYRGPVGSKVCAPQTEDVAFWWFSTFLEQLFPLFSAAELHLVQRLFDDFKAGRLYPACTPIARECHQLIGIAPSRSGLHHRTQLLNVAVAILGPVLTGARQDAALSAADVVTRALEKLSVDEVMNSPAAELSRKFNCSQRHLNRLFHERFGLSVGALRMEIRLLKAASLLRDPEAKVINVAADCGFNHLSLFNAAFKRRFGTSPGKWRSVYGDGALLRQCVDATDPECRLRDLGLCPWAKESSPGEAGGGRQRQFAVSSKP